MRRALAQGLLKVVLLPGQAGLLVDGVFHFLYRRQQRFPEGLVTLGGGELGGLGGGSQFTAPEQGALSCPSSDQTGSRSRASDRDGPPSVRAASSRSVGSMSL